MRAVDSSVTPPPYGALNNQASVSRDEPNTSQTSYMTRGEAPKQFSMNMASVAGCDPTHSVKQPVTYNHLVPSKVEGHINHGSKGFQPMVKALLFKLSNYIPSTCESRTELMLAAFSGDNTKVESLLATGRGVDDADKLGMTPLMYAALSGQYKTAELLMDKGADINKECTMGLSAFHFALYALHSEQGVRSIESWPNKYKAKLVIKNNTAAAIVFDRMHHFRPSVTDLLKSIPQDSIELHAEYVHPDEMPERTPFNYLLATVCLSRDLNEMDLFKKLITIYPKIINEDFISFNGEMVDIAYCVAMQGHTDATKIRSLKIDQNIDKVYIDGKTVLQVAFENNNNSLMDYLLKDGQFVDSRNGENQTLLHLTSKHVTVKMAEYLIGKDASLNLQDNRGYTPLHAAVIDNNVSLVKLLIAKKANLDIKDSSGMTPLLHAAECGHIDCLNALLHGGADCHATNDNGDTALSLAIKNNHNNCRARLEAVEQAEEDFQNLALLTFNYATY